MTQTQFRRLQVGDRVWHNWAGPVVVTEVQNGGRVLVLWFNSHPGAPVAGLWMSTENDLSMRGVDLVPQEQP
jgi:hypothetical protein